MIKDLNIIQHRFAAWAAASAARVSPKCRFRAADGVAILEGLGFGPGYGKPDKLPLPSRFDDQHRKWREKAIRLAKGRRIRMSHGVAAKLINVYLKSRFICGGHADHPKVAALHPPIDSILLKSLADKNAGGFGPAWRALARRRWYNLDPDSYEVAIGCLRNSFQPAWVAEKMWKVQ
jgi:hypothetical protein